MTAQQRRIFGRSWRWWWRWAARFVLLAGVLGMLTVSALAAVIVIYGQQDRAQAADVIVVLGGGYAGTDRRARHAAALYHEGYAPTILCTGATPQGARLSEAARCARSAMRAGVPEDAILLETISRSTEENAIEAAALMRARGWETALVVSDDYHLWRAHWLFEAEGITAWTSPAQATNGSLRLTEEVPSVLREVAATIWYVGKTALGLPYTRVGD